MGDTEKEEEFVWDQEEYDKFLGSGEGARIQDVTRTLESEEPPMLSQPGLGERMAESAKTGEYESVFSPEFLAANAGPIGGGFVGAAVGNPIAGAMIGRGLQNVAQDTAGTRDVSAFQHIAEPAIEGAGQFVGAKYIAPAIGSGIKAGAKALAPLGEVASGVASDLLESIIMRPAQTMAKRFKGSTEVAVNEAREALKGSLGTAGKQYDEIIKAVFSSPKYTGDWRFKIKDALGKSVKEIRDEFDFASPESFGTGQGQIDEFTKMLKVFDGFGDEITAKQLYKFQRNLNRLYSSNVGDEVGAAAKKIWSSLRKEMGSKIVEIVQANRGYAHLKPIEKFAETIMKKDNLVNVLRDASKRGHKLTAQKFKALAQAFPEASKSLGDVLDAVAGEAVQPALGNIPRTGLTGALGLGAASGTVPGAAVPLAAFMSPRFTGRAAALAGNAAQAMESEVGRFATGRATASEGVQGTSSLEDAIRQFLLRKQQGAGGDGESGPMLGGR